MAVSAIRHTLLLLVSLAVSCGGAAVESRSASSLQLPPPAVAKALADVETLRLCFRSGSNSNGHAALHVLVRKVERTEVSDLQYEDVVNKLTMDHDSNRLDWLVLLPNDTCQRSIQRQKGSGVAIYFLFSEPKGQWKKLVSAKSGLSLQFQVETDQIRVANAASAPKEDHDGSCEQNSVPHDCRTPAP